MCPVVMVRKGGSTTAASTTAASLRATLSALQPGDVDGRMGESFARMRCGGTCSMGGGEARAAAAAAIASAVATPQLVRGRLAVSLAPRQ